MTHRLSQVQELNFRRHGATSQSYSVSWVYEDRRYHVWYYPDAGLQDALHSNPVSTPTNPRTKGHRALSLGGLVWANMKADLLAYITPERIAQADAQSMGEEKRRDDAEGDTRHTKALTRIDHLLAQPMSEQAVELLRRLRELPRDELIRII